MYVVRSSWRSKFSFSALIAVGNVAGQISLPGLYPAALNGEFPASTSIDTEISTSSSLSNYRMLQPDVRSSHGKRARGASEWSSGAES
jgi:hypothetical protein